MKLPNLSHAVIVNNLATENPETIPGMDSLVTTLMEIGFKVKQYKDINFQVKFKSVNNRENVLLPDNFPESRKIKFLGLFFRE